MPVVRFRSSTKNISKTDLTDLNFEFSQRLTTLMKDITPAQLDILKDHVMKINARAAAHAVTTDKSILSKREMEVLVLVTNGYSRRDIGSTLQISVNTAARHIANMYQKLGVSCVAEATRYAVANNIIQENTSERLIFSEDTEAST